MAKNGNKSILVNTNNQQFENVRLTHRKHYDNYISFSFRYFHQIDYFGIGGCDNNWFVGLIERLKTLSTLRSSEIKFDNAGSKAIRFHSINWQAHNMPIKRTDLDWLPKDIMDNDESFPMAQMSISNSTGRIIGFFGVGDEASVFYVVLLDPHHNMQPSRKNNYQLQDANRGYSQYDILLSKLEQIISITQKCPYSCELVDKLNEINSLHGNIVYFSLDEDFYTYYKSQQVKYGLKEIIESGILSLIDNDKNTNQN